MMSKSTAPDPILMYTCSVETVLDTRDVELYWGSVAGLVESDSIVLLSTNIFQPTLKGKAWNAINEKFPALSDASEHFKLCVQAGPQSALWPLSEELAANWAEFKTKKDFTVPSVYVLQPPSDRFNDDELGVRRLFYVSTPPFRKNQANEDDYDHALRACFAAICAQEARDLTQDPPLQPYSQIVMSAIAGQQGIKPAQLLAQLLNEAGTWLKASPSLSRIRIAYWSNKLDKEMRTKLGEDADSEQLVRTLRKHLLEELGQVQSESAVPESVIQLRNELVTLIQWIIEQRALPGEVTEALQGLSLTLSRDDHSVLEVGSAAGKLTEGLVNHLHSEFYDSRPRDFFNGIEKLRTKQPTQASYKDLKLSKWFYSYLHTIRVLRNESAHSQEQAERFPARLEQADMSVLLSNLNRVLQMHSRILRQGHSH